MLIARAHPGFVEGLHYVITCVYALTSVMLVWEACAAWRVGRRAKPPDDLPPLPGCTAIFAAYLPNEQDIILETLTHVLGQSDVPPDQFQVILAYNTPESLAIEADLQALAARDPRLLPLRVAGSKSKAENVNAALGAATGEIVAVFDADHLPAPDAFRRAWRWLGDGCDMVQGRCVIRNHAHNWLTRTIAIEFDTIYAVSHPGRAHLSGTAIFGGSNGYWRREVLADLGMNQAMLTEDIDVSVRSLLEGRRLVHDRTIVSAELAPLAGPPLDPPAQALGAGLAGSRPEAHRRDDALAALLARPEGALVLPAGLARVLPGPLHPVLPPGLHVGHAPACPSTGSATRSSSSPASSTSPSARSSCSSPTPAPRPAPARAWARGTGLMASARGSTRP